MQIDCLPTKHLRTVDIPLLKIDIEKFLAAEKIHFARNQLISMLNWGTLF